MANLKKVFNSQTVVGQITNLISNTYASIGRIRRDTEANGGQLADFKMIITLSIMPTFGNLQLIRIPRAANGTQGPILTASNSFVAEPLGIFLPTWPVSIPQSPQAFVIAVEDIALTSDSDYYIYNYNTGQNISTINLTIQYYDINIA